MFPIPRSFAQFARPVLAAFSASRLDGIPAKFEHQGSEQDGPWLRVLAWQSPVEID